jgi:hypothetical protein
LYQRSNTYYLALVGILMSIVLVIKAIFNFVIVLNGYPLDFYIIFYIMGILVINDRKYQWMFALLTPWLLLIIPSASVNFLDMIMEYILALYIFIGFIYFDKLVKVVNKLIKNKKANLTCQVICFAIILFICFCIKLLIHIFSGVQWYIGDHDLSNIKNWYAAFTINLLIIVVNFSVNLPLGILLYMPINKFATNSNLV